MSIKQMSAQLLSVDIADQENYIDLQRMRARQIWDERKHSKLHADVLLGKGWVGDERELMNIPDANQQPLPAYFGLSMMFPHIHPLARAAQNYYTEANACIGIMAYLHLVDDPLVRHEHLSQQDEELMHFMEGKFQLDFYCTSEESQRHVEDRSATSPIRSAGYGDASPIRLPRASGVQGNRHLSCPGPACAGRRTAVRR